jgi:hypothetical protein
MKGINVLQIVLLSISRNILFMIGILGNNFMLTIASMLGYVIIENMITRSYYNAGVLSTQPEVKANETAD